MGDAEKRCEWEKNREGGEKDIKLYKRKRKVEVKRLSQKQKKSKIKETGEKGWIKTAKNRKALK